MWLVVVTLSDAKKVLRCTVTDPCFLTRGTANPKGGGRRKPIIWQHFCRKLHEIERNLIERGQ